jgi:hypothetical protein
VTGARPIGIGEVRGDENAVVRHEERVPVDRVVSEVDSGVVSRLEVAVGDAGGVRPLDRQLEAMGAQFVERGVEFGVP